MGGNVAARWGGPGRPGRGRWSRHVHGAATQRQLRIARATCSQQASKRSGEWRALGSAQAANRWAGGGCGWGRGVALWGARPCASSNWAMPNHCGPSTPRKQLTMWEKGSGVEWGSEKGPTAHTRTNECVHSGSDEPHHNGKRPEAAQWTASKMRLVRLDRGMCATHKRGGGGGGGDGRMVQRATGGQEGGAHHNSVPRGGHSHAWTRPAEKWASRRSHTTLMAVGWGERCTGREGARGTNSKILRAFFYVVAAHWRQ